MNGILLNSLHLRYYSTSYGATASQAWYKDDGNRNFLRSRLIFPLLLPTIIEATITNGVRHYQNLV